MLHVVVVVVVVVYVVWLLQACVQALQGVTPAPSLTPRAQLVMA